MPFFLSLGPRSWNGRALSKEKKNGERESGWAWPLHGSAAAAGAEAKLVMPSCS